jgi:hypothetical protein
LAEPPQSHAVFRVFADKDKIAKNTYKMIQGILNGAVMVRSRSTDRLVIQNEAVAK